MMNLLKKNINSFFCLSTTTDNFHLHSHCLHISSSAGDSGVATTAKEGNELPHVLESGRAKATSNREIEEVDGLTSCTESLGIESSDERRLVDDGMEQVKEMMIGDNVDEKESEDGICWRKNNRWDKKEKSFPPPLTTFNVKGQPSFFLRAVRKDGRLELTEVRIHRTQMLHASREDGRLRLHLIPDHVEEEEEETREGIRNKTSEEEEEEWRGAMGERRRCHEAVNDGRHHEQQHLQMCGVSIM